MSRRTAVLRIPGFTITHIAAKRPGQRRAAGQNRTRRVVPLKELFEKNPIFSEQRHGAQSAEDAEVCCNPLPQRFYRQSRHDVSISNPPNLEVVPQTGADL